MTMADIFRTLHVRGGESIAASFIATETNMKGTAKSTAGAIVLAGAALAATAAWCAPAEDAAGSVMENAVGNTAEPAMQHAAGNMANDAAEDTARSATENDAGA